MPSPVLRTDLVTTRQYHHPNSFQKPFIDMSKLRYTATLDAVEQLSHRRPPCTPPKTLYATPSSCI